MIADLFTLIACPPGFSLNQSCPPESHPNDPSVYSIPTFSVTPYGCLARIACIRTADCFLASLGCQYRWQGELSLDKRPTPVWLPLTPCPDAQDVSRPLFHTGFFHPRTVAFHLHENRYGAHQLEWRELYIALWHTTPMSPTPSIPTELEYSSAALVRFPWDAVQKAFPRWTLKKVSERFSVYTSVSSKSFVAFLY